MNGNYVTREEVITEANKNFDLATTALSLVTSMPDYEAMMGILIPVFCQTGNGGVLSILQWSRNISTMKARNVLVNKRIKEMSTADWNALLVLASNGIQQGDIRVVSDPVVASEILRKERRVALIFRGLAFYDARRVGFLDDVSKGGGRKGAVVLRSTTSLDTNATINYHY